MGTNEDPVTGGAGTTKQPGGMDVGVHTPPPRQASLRDVARLSGVTYQTVSRVINNSPQVRPKTRLRVLAAIEELDYRPNAAARTLASGRSQVIGVLSLGTNTFETPSTLEGIESAAAAAGYAVTFAGARTQDVQAMRHAVHRLVDQRVDGVILIAPLVSTDVDRLPLPPTVPVVAVEGSPDARTAAVLLDQAGGARAATDHLLSLGHKGVWHVSGPRDWYDSRGREAGWREALSAAGIEAPPLLIGDWGPESGYEAGRVLAGVADATAVFVANDTMALGLLRALQEGGRRVPEDVSVVGFDDVPVAAFTYPPLTTVRQEFFEIGRQGIHLLLDQVEGRTLVDPRPRIDAPLVVRQSTAPPPR
jgi:DNA-binding LacI/PurR family transcriptional regulator